MARGPAHLTNVDRPHLRRDPRPRPGDVPPTGRRDDRAGGGGRYPDRLADRGRHPSDGSPRHHGSRLVLVRARERSDVARRAGVLVRPGGHDRRRRGDARRAATGDPVGRARWHPRRDDRDRIALTVGHSVGPVRFGGVNERAAEWRDSPVRRSVRSWVNAAGKPVALHRIIP